MTLVYVTHLTAHINKQKKKFRSENVWSTSDTVNITMKGYGRNHKKSRISLALPRAERHAIAQAFIRWFLTAEICVQYQGSPCGFFGRKSGNGANLRIILSSPYQLTAHYCSLLSSIPQGWGQCVRLLLKYQGIHFSATQKLKKNNIYS
jgi:hypothetical protein